MNMLFECPDATPCHLRAHRTEGKFCEFLDGRRDEFAVESRITIGLMRKDVGMRYPTPSTAVPNGGCPGWIADRVVMLACDRPHAVSKQWQTIAEANAKLRRVPR